MTNVVGRINKLEKEFIPKVKGEIIPILQIAWKEGDRTFYLDSKGETKEYIEKDHREHPIFNFFANKKEALASQKEGDTL